MGRFDPSLDLSVVVRTIFFVADASFYPLALGRVTCGKVQANLLDHRVRGSRRQGEFLLCSTRMIRFLTLVLHGLPRN